MATYANILPPTFTPPTYNGVPAASGANHLVVAPGSTKRIWVNSFSVQASGTVTVTFKDTNGATIAGPWDLQAREGIARTAQSHSWLFATGAGKGLDLVLSGAVPVTVDLSYETF